MSASQPQAVQTRRAYKRYSTEAWNAHKPTIRELFLEQNRSYEEVAETLKSAHDFDVGIRQLKRWTEKWGFYRNIPDCEMRKMARKQQRRQQQLGRPTKFFRKLGDGEFHEVAATKLDAYQKRFGARSPSVASMPHCSSLPSNIMYRTPSGYAPTSREVGDAVATTPSSTDQMALEFNDSAERVFGETDSGGSRALGPSSPEHQARHAPEPHWETLGSIQACLDEALDGNYREAATKFTVLVRGATNACTRLMAQFNADVMEAACYPGGPQSLAVRVVDILTRTLTRQRRDYSSGKSGIKCAAELENALATLKVNAGFWANLLMRQRVLQIWEPILGPNHPRIVLIRRCVSRGRHVRLRVLAPDSDIRDTDLVNFMDGGLAFDPLAAAHMVTPKSVVDLFHLGDAPRARLLEQLQLLESSSVSGQEAWHEMSLQKLGRSKALLGVYCSFICRFEEAEAAFQTSERCMEHETCVEIKLFRMIWYAEHKTRIGAWGDVRRLMCDAHHVFISNDSLPEFVVHHFPNWFSRLYSAITARLPIDKIIDDPPNPTGEDCFGSLPQGPVSPPRQVSPAPEPPVTADSTLSLDRLFPPTPGGTNGGIDIDAWQEFVHYSPAPTSPQ